MTNKDNGRSKGYGFVTFKDPEHAANAIKGLNDTVSVFAFYISSTSEVCSLLLEWCFIISVDTC